jgi:glutamate--cysteine ligase
VATLIDDPVAADLAADAVSGTEQAWTVAARDGLGHRDLRRAAQACLEIAASRCPPEQRPGVERYRELVRRGRTPGDRVRDTVTARGAIAALIEATDA